MDDPLSLVASILTRLNQLVTAIHKSLRSDSALASSKLRESRQKVKVILETSQQKFKIWKETWVKDVLDHAESAEKLWGSEGSSAVQKLLDSVQYHAGVIENELAKTDNGTSHLGWRHTLRTSFLKKDRRLEDQRPSLITLAVQLSTSVDELWTYSEVAFDSLHGIYSHQIGPPRRDMLLTRSLLARPGSLALYQACIQSKADYSLEVNLLGEDAETGVAIHKRSSGSSMRRSGLLYRLFAQNRETPNMVNEITIESMSWPGEQGFPDTEVVQFDIKESDLADDKSWPPVIRTSGLVFIQPKTTQSPSYFRIVKPPRVLNRESYTESLAQLLEKDPIGISSEERPLPQETRVQLAFKVVECGLYLLGTPWLASLSSKRLRKMKTSKGSPFVLEVQTLSLEDLYFEDPDALSEHSQLFSIGVMLVKIALSDERDTPSMGDSDLRKSKILALVERSMGSLYCRATAFCLAHRRSAPHFGGPEKYEDPKEAAWKSYLTELLEEYHAQVYSR